MVTPPHDDDVDPVSDSGILRLSFEPDHVNADTLSGPVSTAQVGDNAVFRGWSRSGAAYFVVHAVDVEGRTRNGAVTFSLEVKNEPIFSPLEYIPNFA